MDRSFKRGFLLGFVVFTAASPFLWSRLAGAADPGWREGDLIRMDCNGDRASVPSYLVVEEVSADREARLGAVSDHVLKRMLRFVEASEGHAFVDEFRGVAWNPESAADEPVSEGVSAIARKLDDGSLEIRHETQLPSYRGKFVLRCHGRGTRCAAVQAVDAADRAPRGTPVRAEFGCAPRKISLCGWLSRLKSESVSRRTEVLKSVGEDNWKSAFDAEQIEKSATRLMQKHACPTVSPSVRLE